MSSAVNKSQKRFMPKVSSRGPGGRAPARRMSTLRTSFSVPTPTDSLTSRRQSKVEHDTSKSEKQQNSTDNNDQNDTSRAQLLGFQPESASKGPESVIEDRTDTSTNEVTNPIPGEVNEDNPLTGTTPNPLNDQQPPVKETRAAKPKPRSAPLVPPKTGPRPATSLSVPSVSKPDVPSTDAHTKEAPSTATLTPANSAGSGSSSGTSSVPDQPTPVIKAKPEAPPGCEVIWPEDLPELRASERRRKISFEKELLTIMRRLYAEREKAKIMEDAEDMMDEEAEALAHEAADQATYNQLKQTVGNEAKALRDEKFEEANPEDTKTLLDVNKFTMAALCRDIPVGDRNDTYDDYELARVNRRRDTVRVFRAKMWSRRMYEPREEERSALKEAFKKYQDERKERSGKIRDEQKQKFTEIDDATTDESMESHPQASIEIQANGDISLVGTQFDRHKNNRSQREGSTGPRTEVDPTEQVINSYSFSTRERPDRWTKEETAKFYEAVSALGTDFNLISHLFPMRSRNQIKTKFKYEEKRNPAKLQMYLVSRRKFNVDSYSQVSNVAIEDVVSIEDELEKVRQEHAEQMKLEEASRMRAKEEDQKKSTKRPAPETANRPYPKRERVE